MEGKVLKVFKTERVESPTEPKAGQAVVVDGDRILISCGDGWLDVLELQLEGKKRMTTKDFLRGYKGTISHVGES